VVFVAVALLLVNCGGRDVSNPPGAVGGATAADGGTASTADECSGGAPDGGCGGEVGERPLEVYARLRTACNLRVGINRRGAPISIDCHIK
jgi:hypothetical protein